MRIHLGHHFYGAGNLGDDFMLAGFLGKMRSLAPEDSFTCCVPFALGPLRRRFPQIDWQPYDSATRTRCIDACDVWLGLGGSPFQNALSRWFVDHLLQDADACLRARKPMFYLGIGVQTATELDLPDTRRLCTQAASIWTRDAASADRLRALPSAPPVETGSDLAHLFFCDFPVPPPASGRVTLVPNFDYNVWPGQDACLQAVEKLAPAERIWLAQESRELPGAERALFAALPAAKQSRWQLVSPDVPGAPLPTVLAHWPSGEWIVTARYHAALAGAWAGSKIVVLSTNEKLRAAARELHAPLLSPDAEESVVTRALSSAAAVMPPRFLAERAHAACAAFLRSAVAHRR